MRQRTVIVSGIVGLMFMSSVAWAEEKTPQQTVSELQGTIETITKERDTAKQEGAYLKEYAKAIYEARDLCEGKLAQARMK